MSISTNIFALVLLYSDSLVLKSFIIEPMPKPLLRLRDVFIVSLTDIFIEFLPLSIGSLILIPVLNYIGSVLFLVFCFCLRKKC